MLKTSAVSEPFPLPGREPLDIGHEKFTSRCLALFDRCDVRKMLATRDAEAAEDAVDIARDDILPGHDGDGESAHSSGGIGYDGLNVLRVGAQYVGNVVGG